MTGKNLFRLLKWGTPFLTLTDLTNVSSLGSVSCLRGHVDRTSWLTLQTLMESLVSSACLHISGWHVAQEMASSYSLAFHFLKGQHFKFAVEQISLSKFTKVERIDPLMPKPLAVHSYVFLLLESFWCWLYWDLICTYSMCSLRGISSPKRVITIQILWAHALCASPGLTKVFSYCPTKFPHSHHNQKLPLFVCMHHHYVLQMNHALLVSYAVSSLISVTSQKCVGARSFQLYWDQCIHAAYWMKEAPSDIVCVITRSLSHGLLNRHLWCCLQTAGCAFNLNALSVIDYALPLWDYTDLSLGDIQVMKVIQILNPPECQKYMVMSSVLSQNWCIRTKQQSLWRGNEVSAGVPKNCNSLSVHWRLDTEQIILRLTQVIRN